MSLQEIDREARALLALLPATGVELGLLGQSLLSYHNPYAMAGHLLCVMQYDTCSVSLTLKLNPEGSDKGDTPAERIVERLSHTATTLTTMLEVLITHHDISILSGSLYVTEAMLQALLRAKAERN